MTALANPVSTPSTPTPSMPALVAKPSRLHDYLMLTRPRMAILILVTVATGACLAAGGLPSLAVLFHAVIGTGLVAAGSSALNQLLERDTDALMRRTETRPLPARRLSNGEVLVFGVGLAVVGLVELALGTNLVAAATAATSLATYVLAYTPLKRRTSFNTVVGAIPGALPPVIGWSAVTGSLDAGAAALFGIIFVWQFPHFLAIAWLNREDYARAGLKMLPTVEGGQRITGWQALNYAIALVPVSLFPALLGVAGEAYFLGALWLGVAFLAMAASFMIHESRATARRLLLGSLVYLPVLLGLMWLDRLVPTA